MYTLRSGALRYDVNAVSRETGLDCDAENFPSKTVQSEKDNADINVIVRRFGLTGTMPVIARMPSYGDYEGVGDFQSAMNVVRAAEESFAELPAKLRARFGNSPQAYLEFVSNPENVDEMMKLGLAIKRADGNIPPTAEIPPPIKESKNASGTGKRADKAAKAPPRADSDGDGE